MCGRWFETSRPRRTWRERRRDESFGPFPVEDSPRSLERMFEAEMDDLDAALDAAARHIVAAADRVDGDAVPAGAGAARRLRATVERLRALLCEVEVALDRSEAWRDDGATSLRAWLIHECGVPRRVAGAEARRVERLGAWPQVVTAWRDGRVSSAQVDAMVGIVPARFVERFAEDAAGVLAVVAPLDARSTEVALRQWVRCVEADDGPDDFVETASGVHVATFLDESLSISGVLHGADAAIVEAALRVFAPSHEVEVDAEGVPLGPPPTIAGRTAQALVAMAQCAMAHRDGPGEHGRFLPHVLVTVDVAELRAAALRGAGVRTIAEVEARAVAKGWSAVETAWFHEALGRHGDGVTAEGMVLDPAAIAALSCESVVQRLHQSGSRVLDLGREVRTATPSQRKAVIARDRHCRAPGCRARPRHCDVHHIDNWIEGGRTDVGRMVLLCGTHHRHFHRDGWSTELDDDATFTVHSPRGWSRSTTPDRDERTVFVRRAPQ